MIVLGDAQMPAREFQHRVLRKIGLLFRHDQHAHAGDDQEESEDIEHPAEFRTSQAPARIMIARMTMAPSTP